VARKAWLAALLLVILAAIFAAAAVRRFRSLAAPGFQTRSGAG
jgi:hypothetical protein